MEPIFLDITTAVGITLRTVVIFLYAFVLLRFLGKRHLSHLMYTDLMLIIAFGSAVGDVMIYGEQVVHLYASMLSITVVAIIVKVLEEISSHSTVAGRLIEGKACLLIDKGEILKPALERENISEESLLSLLREKNISSIKGVRKAFIEPDGELSVIPYKK